MNEQDTNKGWFGGLTDLVTAVKNLVISANTINQTLSAKLPGGLSIVTVSGTITPGGTTGAQTINKPSGSVNFAAAASSLVVTNSLVNASSIILAEVLTNDGTMTACIVVPASGSFTIIANSPATGVVRVGFLVLTTF